MPHTMGAPLESAFPAASAGIRAQWTQRHNRWPPLFDVLASAPRCLMGLMSMRAHARTDASRSLYEGFEARLCGALEQDAIDWPAGFGIFTSRPARALGEKPTPHLPRLAPEQALLLGGPLQQLPLASARVFAAALETALGPDANWPIADDAMTRMLADLLPSTWQGPWRRGQGLEPPAVFVPVAWASVNALVSGLHARKPVAAIPTELEASAAIAVTFAVATVELAVELAVEHRERSAA